MILTVLISLDAIALDQMRLLMRPKRVTSELHGLESRLGTFLSDKVLGRLALLPGSLQIFQLTALNPCCLFQSETEN